MPEPTKPGFRKIEAAGAMKKLMADYFYELDAASKGGSPKVAWCTSVGPAELLRSFGFLVHFPENHGALLGATRMATDLIPAANAIGYSPDICSYLTSDIGAYLKGVTPLSKAYPGIEKLPRPDVLVYNTNQCRDVYDWLAFYAREFGVPLLGIETPRNVGEVGEAHIRDVAQQMEQMVPALEEISGRRFDLGELKRILAISRETTDLWKQVLETAAHLPAPLTFFDGTIHMGPAVVLRGDQRATDYYKLLLAELEGRVRESAGAVEGERHRLYWEGMPIWGKLRDLSGLFLEHRTCVVASTYCNSWIFTAFDPDDPFPSMARAYTELFIVRSEPYKEEYIQRMVETFRVDGIVFHDSKTCPNNSNNRYGLPERLRGRLGVPFVTLHGDLNDLRCYSEEQAVTNLEAFLEGLAK